MVCPVRDLPAKDLALLCHHSRCATFAPPGRPPQPRDKPSINRISTEFVAGMQAALPSTVPTILRTASKLKVQNPVTLHCFHTALGCGTAAQLLQDAFSEICTGQSMPL